MSDLETVGCTTCHRAMYTKDVDKEGNCPDCTKVKSRQREHEKNPPQHMPQSAGTFPENRSATEEAEATHAISQSTRTPVDTDKPQDADAGTVEPSGFTKSHPPDDQR